MSGLNPQYPVFIPTKGRWEKPLTINTFKRLGVPFRIVVEEPQYDQYKKIVDKDQIIVLPHKDEGLTVTRNWIWDFALDQGYKRFWTFDDNIDGLFRLNRNLKTPVADGTIMRIIEDFADRYKNLHLTGMNYFMFASRKSGSIRPYTMNTRVYSNMLIRTDVKDSSGKPFRNVTFYNDDTDLCLRMLKDGLPIVLFNAFLIGKAQTMTIKGGMTEYYKSEECQGRLKFAQELVDAHPDVARVTWKFNRWHHEVNYAPFKKNKLIRVDNYEELVRPGIDNYGMKLLASPFNK